MLIFFQKLESIAETSEAEPGTREYFAQDLRKLIASSEVGGKDEEDDLPPLLQALTRGAKHDGKRDWIERRLRELEAREEERRQQESIEIRLPDHPQPATVTNHLPNKMVVRTSDVRVSERVCLSEVTLKKNGTVYNDLNDEVKPRNAPSVYFLCYYVFVHCISDRPRNSEAA